VLDVLEQVNREKPQRAALGLVHCETLQPKTLERLAALAGSIDIQKSHVARRRGFLKKYGARPPGGEPPIAPSARWGFHSPAAPTPPPTSTTPGSALHWLGHGQDPGGTKLQGDKNLLDRTEALRLYTSGGLGVGGGGEEGTSDGKFAISRPLGRLFQFPPNRSRTSSRSDRGRRQGRLGRRPFSRFRRRCRRSRGTGCRYGSTAVLQGGVAEAQNLARAMSQPGIIADDGRGRRAAARCSDLGAFSGRHKG